MPGQYYDSETNNHYNYYRDYDPSIGRYVESDPIGLRGGINTYGYVGGNPLTRIDSNGRVFWIIAGGLIGGGLDLAAQYARNGSLNNIDLTELALATASGAIGGGVGTVIGNLTKSALVAGLANAEVGAVTGLIATGIHNAVCNANDSVVKGAVIGGAFGFMGGYAGTAMGNWISEAGGVAQSGWNSAMNVLLPQLSRPINGTSIQGVANSIGSSVSNAVGNSFAGMSPFYGN